jgi:hypothetical protein
VNLFIVGRSRDGPVDAHAAGRALDGLLERLPFFEGCRPQSWTDGRAVLAWVEHPADQTGGVSYVVTEPHRFALFAGRPFAWTSGDATDGRAPLDPRFYLDGIPEGLDGRWAAVRYGDGKLEVACDRMGAYPVYTADSAGVQWFSNSPEAVRSLHGGRTLSEPVLASVLGGGWSLTGDPVWAGVRRMPREPCDLAFGAGGFDVAAAAACLTAAVRALAGWSGRPDVVPVTGGRDSRLVLAAALAGGIDFTTTTGAVPGSRDLDIGRALADAAGVQHEPIPDDPHGSVSGDWRRAAELIALTSGGTSVLSDAAGYPFGPRPGALPLWHSGQGGEIARSYYGLGDGLSRDALTDRLYRSFVGRRPGRRELISDGGAQVVRGEIARFVDEALARRTDPIDIPNAFYLERRMGTWAGPTHGCVEYVRDTTSPLWSERVVREALRLDARSRAAERFHVELLRELAPALMAIPYEDGALPGERVAPSVARARRARALSRKVAAAARRRLPGPRSASDPFEAAMREVRDLVLSQREHPAWTVLDRLRVEHLLMSDARSLDTMSRYYLWRLATVFSLQRE